MTDPLLIGREDNIRRLNKAWECNEHTIVVVGRGGEGKTALVNHWLGQLSPDDVRSVFGWSFEIGGATEEQVASAGVFFHQALENGYSSAQRYIRV